MPDRISGGYIIIAKKIIDSEIWKKPPLYLKVWLYLLQRAQYKPYRSLEKGQLFVTIKDIQENCSWFVGCRKSTPTKDQIFQILNWMRNPSVSPMEATTKATMKATMITTTKATHGILITVDNYCDYQNPKLYESNDESNDESNIVTATKAIGEQRTPNNINKEGIKKNKNTKKENLPPEALDLSDYLTEKITEWKPDARINSNNWPHVFRLMMEQDQRKPDDIAAVIKWATQDSFWQSNILSADAVRRQFDKLQGQMMRGKKNGL